MHASHDHARSFILGLIVLAGAFLSGCAHDVSSEAPATQPGITTADVAAPGEQPPAPPLTGEETIRQSLGVLTSHGLDPAVYLSSTANVREAWLLAGTHLLHGVTDTHTGAVRPAPDLTLAAHIDRLPPESGPDAFAQALERLAPQSALYKALQAELTRQQGLAAPESAAQTRNLIASMERLRRLPEGNHERFLMANIPAFEVITYEDGAETSRRPAIVGQISRQTPEFSDEMEFLIFNPWWEVPASIAIRDKLPQFRRDPGTVERLGYHIYDRSGQRVGPASIDWSAVSARSFPYHIRQAPGASNALGQVKFIFPNAYNVYLHDTPEKALFSQTQRTFSSGCIRVAEPLSLAEWALTGTPGWDRSQIEAAVSSGRETRANLTATLPVHVVYLTAFPSPDGKVSFLQDVYGRDAPLLAAMAPYLKGFQQSASLGRPLAASGAGSINAGQPKKDTDHGDCLYRSS